MGGGGRKDGVTGSEVQQNGRIDFCHLKHHKPWKSTALQPLALTLLLREGKEAALGVGRGRRSMCQPCSGMQAYLMALAAFPSCQKCLVESAVQQEVLAADRGKNTQEGRSCLVSRSLSISLCPSVSLSVLPSRWPPTASLCQMPLC